jgi:uncharacterized membrane protein
MSASKFGKGLMIFGLITALISGITFLAQPSEADAIKKYAAYGFSPVGNKADKTRLWSSIGWSTGTLFAIMGGLVFVSFRETKAPNSSASQD